MSILVATGCVHPDDAEDAASGQRRAALQQRYDQLARDYEAIRPPAQTPPIAAAGCDATALADGGGEQEFHGNHSEALRLYEASLACELNPTVAEYAFQSACQLKDAARARAHFKQMDVDADKRELYRAACVAYGVDLAD